MDYKNTRQYLDAILKHLSRLYKLYMTLFNKQI